MREKRKKVLKALAAVCEEYEVSIEMNVAEGIMIFNDDGSLLVCVSVIDACWL